MVFRHTTMCALCSKKGIGFIVSTCRTYRETRLMIDAELCRHIMNQTVQVRTRGAWNSLFTSRLFLDFVVTLFCFSSTAPCFGYCLVMFVLGGLPHPFVPGLSFTCFVLKRIPLCSLSLSLSLSLSPYLLHRSSFCFSIHLLHSSPPFISLLIFSPQIFWIRMHLMYNGKACLTGLRIPCPCDTFFLPGTVCWISSRWEASNACGYQGLERTLVSAQDGGREWLDDTTIAPVPCFHAFTTSPTILLRHTGTWITLLSTLHYFCHFFWSHGAV